MNLAVRNDGLISVALCTYNGAQYIQEQLQSIVDQTYRNLEIVICDDNSQDQTVDIIAGFQRTDSRIKLYRNDINIGFVQNFKQALSLCNGALIALADQDDIWVDIKIQTLASEIGDSWLIYSAVGVIDQHGLPLDRRFPKVHRLQGACALALMLGNSVTGHASLMRRELRDLALPDMDQMPYHDQWLGMVAAAHGRLKASPDRLSLYRLHQNNTVLSRKVRSSASRYARAKNAIERKIEFFSAVVSAKALSSADQELAVEFLDLYRLNLKSVFNWRLRQFLRKNKGTFMAAYKDPDKQIRKLSRGVYYYVLLPFS